MVVGGIRQHGAPQLYSMVVGGIRQHGAFEYTWSTLGVHLEYTLLNNRPITCSERVFIFFRLHKPVLRIFIPPVINYNIFSV